MSLPYSHGSKKATEGGQEVNHLISAKGFRFTLFAVPRAENAFPPKYQLNVPSKKSEMTTHFILGFGFMTGS